MADSSLRAMLQPQALQPGEADQLQAQIVPSGEFGRGMEANQLNSKAGDLYSQSLDAELNGDLRASSALRAKAANTMSLAPKLQTRDQGFGGYAAGVLGQMAPDLPKYAAAGLAGRGLGALAGMGRAGELAGAGLAGYGPSRNAAITAQEQDPAVMAQSPQLRADAATREGLLGGALGAVPISHALSSATRPGLRGLFQGAGVTAAENAGISAAQTAYGQHELSGLNPNRDTSGDIDALKEAAISGGIGGAGMHAAFAVPGLPLRAVNEVTNLAGKTPAAMAALREAAAPAVDRAQDLGEQGVGAMTDTAQALKDRFGPAAEAAVDKVKDFAQRGTAAAQDIASRVPEAIRTAENPSDFLSQVLPNIRKTPETPADEAATHFPPTVADELGEAPATAAPFNAAGKSAREIYENLKSQASGIPDQARDYFGKAAKSLGIDADPGTPEGQKSISDALASKTRDLGSKVNDFISGFKGTGTKASEAAEGAPDLSKLVFEHLTPEARQDPQIRDNLTDLTDALTHATTTGGNQGLAGYKRVASVFKDPDAFEREFGKAIKGDTSPLAKARSAVSAADDAAKPDSYLYTALTDNAKDSLKSGQLAQVGDLVDRMSGMNKQDYQTSGAKLVSVFGSKKKAQDVIDYYRNDFRSKTKPEEKPGETVLGKEHDPDAAPEHTLTEEHDQEDMAHAAAPLGYDEAQSEYRFKDDKAMRPFFAGEDTSKATEAARAEGQSVKAVNHLDFAHEHGLDVEQESGRLRADVQRRLDDVQVKGQKAPPDQREDLRKRYSTLKGKLDLIDRVQNATKPVRVEGHGVVQPGHEGVLQLHTVLATEPKGREARSDASQKEMLQYGNIRGQKEDIKSTLINAHLKDPVTGTVKARTFSLEAMARAEAKQGGVQDWRAAAARGMAKIMARPDFVKFEKSDRGNELNDLVVHRATNTKLDISPKAVKEGAKWTDEQVATLEKGKDGLSDLIGKYKSSDRTDRSILQDKLEKRSQGLRGEATGAGPSGKYAARRADLIDAALDKMSKVRLNEHTEATKDTIVKQLDKELGTKDRDTVRMRQREISRLEDMKANARKKLTALAGVQDTVRNPVSAAERRETTETRAAYEKAGSEQKEPIKNLRALVPRDKRDEFNVHNARYNAAEQLLRERNETLRDKMRDAVHETGEAGKQVEDANTAEDNAARKFRDDFEVFGRADEDGTLKGPKPGRVKDIPPEEHEKSFGQAKDGASGERDSNYYTSAGPAEPLDLAVRKSIQDEFVKSVGPHVELRLEQALGGKAGTYTPKTETAHAIVRAAIGATAQVQSAVWHESMHHLFNSMGDEARSPQARAAYRDMKSAVQSPTIQRQLRELLKDFPKALDQLHDPDESLAYTYQFWRQGEQDGKALINLSPNLPGIFGKIRDFLFNALGVISKTEKVEKIFAAFHDGDFAKPEDIDAAIADLHANTLRDRLDHVAPGVGKAFDALMLGATDRLRSYGYNSLDKIADLMHKEPDRESGALPFLQRRGQVNGIEMNRFQDAVGNPTHVELKSALNNLQSMKAPSTALEKNIRGTLDHLFTYMDKAGVKIKDDDGKWQPLNKRYQADYFPRVWDRRVIDGDRVGMRALLIKEGGFSRKDADATIDRMTSGDGLLDLAENEHHLGFTPANRSLTSRQLDFINASNADKFVKYQSQDMNEIMSKYIYQATHRAEYARSFGNDGEVIRQALNQARSEGASAEDLASAGKAIAAMEGTLGHDFNPQLRKLFTGLTAYQNIVLLPFALLSSLSDVSGIALRSNEFKDSFRAMQLGVRGIARQLTRADESGDKLLQRAKDYGIVDSMNMLENYGNIYNSSFMSPTLRKVNDKFFKYNGMEMWNRQMRLAGFEAGQRFILREAQNSRYMSELGLKKEDMPHLKPDQDGGIDLDSLPDSTRARMQGALYRFVDGAVLRPNAAQRPVWASDPAWMLVAHLKQFAYSFQNTFIKRYANELGHGNSKAGLAFMSFLPFGIFSGAVRRGLAGQAALGGLNAYQVLNDGAMRSGMYGTGMFMEDAIGDVQRGKLPGTSFLGPTAEHAQKVLEFATGGPETASQLAMRSTPLSPLVKDFSPAPD